MFDRNAMRIALDNGAYPPVRAHETDAGLDLRIPHDLTIAAKGYAIVYTGVHVELPRGTTGFLKSKSGLNVNYGIVSEGVIDVGYTGEIVVKLYNHGNQDYTFKTGDKITQLVILPCYTPELILVNELAKTERGNNGFGSTGV